MVFGLWFLTCLVLAVRAIRRDDIVHHRRWMIRAFAIGIGIGTVRIWLALFGCRGGRRIELRSGVLDLVQPACGGRRTLAAGISESSRVCPRGSGLYLDCTPGGCRRTCRLSQTGAHGAVRRADGRQRWIRAADLRPASGSQP